MLNQILSRFSMKTVLQGLPLPCFEMIMVVASTSWGHTGINICLHRRMSELVHVSFSEHLNELQGFFYWDLIRMVKSLNGR